MAVRKSERKRIPDLCGREAEGTTTMLSAFEGGVYTSTSAAPFGQCRHRSP